MMLTSGYQTQVPDYVELNIKISWENVWIIGEEIGAMISWL